jgi:hypothetical protein
MSGLPVRQSDREITPVPGSGPKRRFVVDDAPPELRDNFMVQFFASLDAEEQAELDACAEARLLAAEQYGEDAGRELADLEAGVHPMQRLARSTP